MYLFEVYYEKVIISQLNLQMHKHFFPLNFLKFVFFLWLDFVSMLTTPLHKVK